MQSVRFMANVAAWFIFILGIAHIVYGLIGFKAPVADALSAGFVGQFKQPEVRRTAFWFLIAGPLLSLAGQVCIHAVARGDLALLKLVGIYLFVIALIGVLAMPKSGFWGALIASPFLIAAGGGFLT